MKSIQRISDDIECIIDKAERFAKSAIEVKESSPNLADAYYRIATDALTHINLLHTQVVAEINAYKQTGKEVPKEMQILYDMFHKKHIENTAMVKGMLTLFKEM